MYNHNYSFQEYQARGCGYLCGGLVGEGGVKNVEDLSCHISQDVDILHFVTELLVEGRVQTLRGKTVCEALIWYKDSVLLLYETIRD